MSNRVIVAALAVMLVSANVLVLAAPVRPKPAVRLMRGCSFVVATASAEDTLGVMSARVFAQSPGGCAGTPGTISADIRQSDSIPALLRRLIDAPAACPKGTRLVGDKRGGVINASGVETRSLLTRRQYVMRFSWTCGR